MLAVLVLAASTPIAYGLGPSVRAAYDVEVTFDGYIPIFGGQVAKVDVKMAVDVRGLVEDDQKRPRASSEITEFTVLFNGSKLPLTVQSVQEFFPKTTVSLTPQGKVAKTDAPNVALPVRLPGLDAKRFPDITYLPIEFPDGGIEVGKPFEFKKAFGDSDVVYSVTPSTITEGAAELDVKLSQTYEVLEDSGGNIVKGLKDAVSKVATTLTGSGKVSFDRKRNLANKVDIEASANSTATNLKSGEKLERKLKTLLRVRLKP